MSVVVSPGHTGADSSATACSPMRAPCAARSRAAIVSQPPWNPAPPWLLGYERLMTSPSPRAKAMIPALLSTQSCSMRLPSLLPNVLRLFRNSMMPVVSETPSTERIAASAAQQKRELVVGADGERVDGARSAPRRARH